MTHSSSLPKRRVITSDVTLASYGVVINEIIRLAKTGESHMVFVPAVHQIIEAYWDKHFNQMLNQADIVCPDGKPISIAMNLLYGTQQERVDGISIMPDILKAAAHHEVSVFLLGTHDETLQLIKTKAETEYPKIKITGMYAPPFVPLEQYDNAQIRQMIQDARASLVLVSLGCPKQELWMAQQKGWVNAVMIGIGAAFPIYAGKYKRAPQWMQNCCLEWAYRLSKEPTRLFWRYFSTNTMFILLFLKQWVGIRVFKKH